ncbi:MAG: PaaI family thioesterase [Proteobacteria bacterium]|nr:PaaI family thioesterase [Pseudomonadota bacterium]MBU4471546.1 PaaI family thioesterase [Pseudomonadota bacterium]MCG2752552.1 PaaI family thioesterase [Desulfobacteraceae bacterium]
MDETLKAALFKAAARENFSATMGFELKAVDEGYSEVEFVYDPQTMNNLFGTAHGGAIFSLMDEAFQIACQTHGTLAVALNVNVTYIAGPREKARLKAIAREISSTRKTAGYDIRVTDSQGRLIATCQALCYRTGKPLPFM